MNAGPLPPVPALIPISALRKAAGNNGRQEMGEQQQRPRRQSPNQPRIDSCGGGERPAAAAVARKTERSPRHHRRKCRAPRTRPQNRINPIFVWVKQEDTRIVDVKCEDYDKRNRILLTKTAQGWRAIPRTETLVPSLKDAASTEEHATHHHHHHHHHKSKKSRKNKVRRRSTGVQVTSDLEEDEEIEQEESENKGDDLESLLPSHTIKVNRAVTPQKHDEDVEVSVNVNTTAATAPSDVTPLDNLLAVAELEFNQQVRSGEWEEKLVEHGDKEFDLDLIEPTKKSEECDYTEEDDNNIAMDDILSRLEQSLQSPECTEVHTNFESEVTKVDDENANDASDNETTVPEIQSDPKPEVDPPRKETDDEELLQPLVESSTVDDEEPKDLTVKSTEANDNDCDVLDEPTDLSIPKISTSPPPRPVSQNSEAIQSPQPSGIPAVPPSPDIVSTTVNSKSKSVFLESLLANTTNKIELNSEVTITRQAEPLDLGKCSRKSASPTVTCSEEVSSIPELEPPSKKFKPSVDITIKNILDVEEQKSNDVKSKEKGQTETPRLIELLKNDSEPDALVQLKQLLADPSINVPDPILIPKDKFTTILMKPGVEIPKLLKERPELRLPEALAYPHIMQDPNMLVLNVHDLEAILASRCGQENSDKEKNDIKKIEKEKEKESGAREKGEQQKVFTELANDIDNATQTAFNQMLWLPYLNQLESMGYNPNTELTKMLSGSLPFYPNQMADLSHMFGTNPLTANMPFAMQQLSYGNMIEMRMWQQAMMQADMLRNKSAMEAINNKYAFKDYLEKNSTNQMRKNSAQSSLNQIMQASNKQHYPSSSVYTNGHSGCQNPYANINPHQSNNSRMNAQRSTHRNSSYAHRQNSNTSYQQKQLEASQHLYNLAELEKQHHYMQSLSGLNQEYNIPQRRDPQHKPKVMCKPFASLSNKPVESRSEFVRHPVHHAPIDLSGIPSLASKQKIKQHHMGQVNAAKSQAIKHHEDVPEVGSTTASIEEMQDAHKHLWHPLFGSQQGQQGSKGYPVPGMGAYGGVGSPWPWPGVIAGAGAGE